ncbi:MAG: Ig-like domain-containing protein, partial [Vicinamibacterales bacterium]
GPWGQLYDIYFGTTPTPPLLVQNQQLGPSQSSTDYKTYTLPSMQPGTTYYWQIVSKTMAYVTAAGPVWSFTTAGNSGTDVPPTVAITSPTDGAAFSTPANINITATASDSDGTVTRVDFYQGSTLIGSATSAPWTITWKNVPAGSYSLTAIAADNGGDVTTSSAVSITVGSAPLPSGWTDADVGATGAAGSASYSNGVFTVSGAGADVWGTADAFNYAYLPLSGDGWIQARVAAISNEAPWVKAGVMIRGSLSPSSAQAFMLVSYAKGVAFQRRTSDGNTSVSTAGSTSTAPRWVRLARTGSTISAYESADGSSWTLVGSDTFAMGGTVFMGLAVSSHIAGTLATGTFDNVSNSAAGNNPPSVEITSPSAGAMFTAPADITVSANASDSDGTVSKVDFYENGTLIGTAASSPYSIAWNNVADGSYSLTAIATDDLGATTTSTAVAITVGSAHNNPPSVAITSPPAGATFTAPANITITADASDSDGTVSKVDFYENGTLIGTAASAPYSIAWNNVPSGNYSLAAVATDNQGATTTSTAVSITVGSGTGGGGLPSGWSDTDVGATGAAGSATYNNPTFTVQGAGADVWGTSDAFNYAYEPLAGDGTIVARVATVSNQAAWVKAGVMIRGSLTPSSAQAFMLVSFSKGVAFQRRTSDGAASVNTAGSTATAPHWVKLVRSGSTITASESSDGSTWTIVGSDAFAMGSSVFVGLAVSSHVNGTLATATFDSVSLTSSGATGPAVSMTSPASGATFTAPASITVAANATDSGATVSKVDFYENGTLIGTAAASPYSVTWNNVPAGTYSLTAIATDSLGQTGSSAPVSVTVNPASTLPSGWSDVDVGTVPIAGSASFSAGTFSVTGSGTDIWGTADQFHYAYTPMNGDGTIIARVATIQNVAVWVKAGVMIRETLDAGSTHALILVSSQKGVAFQRRETTGGQSVSTTGSLAMAPHWVKLTRSGSTFTAYESADGTAWTEVGTDTIPMGSSVFVGLAVTSHTSSSAATCTFDNVSIQ